MRIMYVAPRYHTNQLDIVKGLMDRGDEVKYICYYTSQIEDYSLLQPEVLGFSSFSQFINNFYINVIKKNKRGALDIRIKYGIPPVKRLKRLIREFNPDILILRDRTFYSIFANWCKPKGTISILYNQSPYYDKPPKNDLFHKIVYVLTPKYRYTPVLGTKDADKKIGEHDYYLPFVTEPHCAPNMRQYFKDDCVNIMCIGVFTPRKNHMMLFDAVNDLRSRTGLNLRLTLVGEAVEDNQIEYLGTIKKYICENEADDWVRIYRNLSRQEVFDIYLENDLFVIPSTKEPASISQLEAMSFGLPAIVSDSNGTACYTINGSNGYLFRDNDCKDLTAKIEEAVSSRERLLIMADNAYASVVENNSFDVYYEGIKRIADDIRKDTK